MLTFFTVSISVHPTIYEFLINHIHISFPGLDLSIVIDILNFDTYYIWKTEETMYSTTVSPKRKYTLFPSRVLKTEGGQMKSKRCAKLTIDLVQTGPSLILKLKEMAAYQQHP